MLRRLSMNKWNGLQISSKYAGIPGLSPLNSNWLIVNGSAPAPATVVDNALPVRLSRISARSVKSGVIITWVTESEVDNLGFILERSDYDQDNWFKLASYITHDCMKGLGNTSSRTSYLFTDLICCD